MRPVFSAKECVFPVSALAGSLWKILFFFPPPSERRTCISPHMWAAAHTNTHIDSHLSASSQTGRHAFIIKKKKKWKSLFLSRTRHKTSFLFSPAAIISQWRRQDSQLNQSSHLVWMLCKYSCSWGKGKAVTNSGSLLPLSPLPTVKRCLDGKRITALLPTWDACWGLYCVCAWKALLLKCWRAMAKCRDRVREMQIVLLVSASWLYLDNA